METALKPEAMVFVLEVRYHRILASGIQAVESSEVVRYLASIILSVCSCRTLTRDTRTRFYTRDTLTRTRVYSYS